MDKDLSVFRCHERILWLLGLSICVFGSPRAVMVPGFFVPLQNQTHTNMKKETKDRIRKSLAKLERALDERNEYMAARRAYLFRDPRKKILPS